MRPLLFLAAAMAVVAPHHADAQEVFGGVFAHDVETPVTRSGQEGGVDLHLGWRGSRIGSLRAIGAPAPHAFVQVNSRGDTNAVSAGLSWTIGRRVYARPGVGVALHDGPLGLDTPPDRIDFGSRVVFVPELSLGVRVAPDVSVEASWVHYSHAQLLGDQNPGSDNFGVRLAWRYR